MRIDADKAFAEPPSRAITPEGRFSIRLTGLADERDALTVRRPHGQRLVLGSSVSRCVPVPSGLIDQMSKLSPRSEMNAMRTPSGSTQG